MKIRHFLAIPLLALALLGCGQDIPPDTFPGQPVTQRRELFKQMLRAFEPMGLMVRGKAPYSAEKFATHAAELKRLSELPWSHFPPGSDYPPTKVKPAVWEKADQFKAAQDKLTAAVEILSSTTKTLPAKPPTTAYDDVSASCSSCHKAFRN